MVARLAHNQEVAGSSSVSAIIKVVVLLYEVSFSKMKKFNLSDSDVVQQIYVHFKTFDKFDELEIQVEERYLASIYVSVALKGDNLVEFSLPHRDGFVGIPKRFENQILYLSWQVIYFKDVEKLLGVPLLVKSFKVNITDYALGETVVDGVKYEFSLASCEENNQPDFHIEVKFTRTDGYFQFNSTIKTEQWYPYSSLDETFYRLESLVDHS